MARKRTRHQAESPAPISQAPHKRQLRSNDHSQARATVLSKTSSNEHNRVEVVAPSKQEQEFDEIKSHITTSETDAKSQVHEADHEDIVNLRGLQRPDFVLPSPASSSLRDRLRTFLPELAESNDAIAHDKTKSMEDVEEDKPYIQFDLGLGVLEEQHESASSSGDSQLNEDVAPTQPSEEHALPSLHHGKQDVLQHLLGRPRQSQNAGIHEVG